MSSGRRPKIMIACVTFETVKVADPVDFYEANKVYLIHYTSPNHPIYMEFYDQTVNLIRQRCGERVQIVEKEEKVWIFTEMLRTIVSIIDAENAENDGECDIFVNISAGSPEYSAAATIASMMYENTTPFSTSVSKYTVGTDEDIRRCYFRRTEDMEGVVTEIPVGLATEIKEPVKIPHYHIKKPPEGLVRGLRIYSRLSVSNGRPRRVTAPEVIRELKAIGLWNHEVDPRDEKKVKNEKSSNAVYFHREFIERWLKHKWITQDSSGKKYVLTDEGRRIIDTFYTE